MKDTTTRFTRHHWVMIICLLAACVAGCVSSPAKPAQSKGDNLDLIADQPPNAKTLYSMAKVLITQGRDREAVELLSRLIKQYPTYLPAYNEMAAIYVRSDRLSDAIAILAAGLKQAPQDGVLHNNTGLCWFLRQDYDRALASFRDAVKAVPDNPMYRANEAAALAMLGRKQEAIAAYRGVLDDGAMRQNIDVFAEARRTLGAEQLKAPASQPATRATPHSAEPASVAGNQDGM